MVDTNLTNYINLLSSLERNIANINNTGIVLDSLWNYWEPIYKSDKQNNYGVHMPMIGMYIASASLVCVIAMVADLVHGFRNRKLWFPCKYFTLNAGSLSAIAIAIKIPMDINNPTPGYLDLASKLVSLAFLCTMMANSLPSLASMESKELVANIVASGILVITLVVNVCIQILSPAVVSIPYVVVFRRFMALFVGSQYYFDVIYVHHYVSSAIIYVAMLLLLLIIQICSGLMILISKCILESKYQTCHEKAFKEKTEFQQQAGSLNVEKLKQHVNKYWIMAGTSSPQFMTACLPTTSAAGVISAASIFLLINSLILALVFYIYEVHSDNKWSFRSDYEWSIPVILIIQFIGVLLGTIAPLCRCFATLSLKVSIKWIGDHIRVFKVESYWTRKLYDWKQSRLPFPFRSHKCKVVIEKFKVLILDFFILFQKMVVITCKMTMLIPIFFIFCVFFCINCWKWLKVDNCWKCLKVMFSALGIFKVKEQEQHLQYEDFSPYIVKLPDDMEPAERTLKGITKSMNRLIRRAEKKQPKHLIDLLKKSKGFEGIEDFDRHHVPPLFPVEYPDCWSLPLLSLTTIAISLPNIPKDIVKSLLMSVLEGLHYVILVEESLNAAHEYASIQKAAKMLWLEVEVGRKWLGNKSPQGNTPGDILEWYRNTAKNMVSELEGKDTEASDESSVCKSLCAKSMYHITQTILISYQDTNEDVSREVFEQLSSMISGILAACLTNLPQVIAMKCHMSSIEKREASVYAAAKLLGETTQIINNLQDRELPSLNPDEFPFINKWCAYFRDTFP